MPEARERASSSHVLWDLWRRFYPLAMTDFAMTLGDMLRPIALSRLPNTELALAATGVVKSIAVFLESPIIMILHASTALSANKQSHRALWSFTLMSCGMLSSIFLVMFFQPLYDWLFIDLFGVSQETAALARFPFFLMIPWPALIAVRRFHQGLLVRHRREQAMAQAGMIRLLFTVLVLWAGTKMELQGTTVAALSLIGAVAIEALVVVYLSLRAKFSLQEIETTTLPTNVVSVARYYAPLGSTSMIVWGARALILGVIARAPDGVFGIAIWTAAMGFVLPIANATRMVQQIVISSPTVSRQMLLRFTLIIGAGCSLPLIVLGFTEPGLKMLSALLGDKSTIINASILVMEICFVLPLLTAFQNSYQGFLILSNKHWWINAATLINVVVSLGLTMVLINSGMSGEASAAIATMLGLFIEVGILIMKNRR